MSARIKKYKKELCFLGTCKKQQRVKFIKHAPAGVIHAIGDAAKTLLHGDLPIKEYHRRKLRKEIKSLKTLAARRESIAKKRKILTSQKGGSFLGTIWNVIKEIF